MPIEVDGFNLVCPLSGRSGVQNMEVAFNDGVPKRGLYQDWETEHGVCRGNAAIAAAAVASEAAVTASATDRAPPRSYAAAAAAATDSFMLGDPDAIKRRERAAAAAAEERPNALWTPCQLETHETRAADFRAQVLPRLNSVPDTAFYPTDSTRDVTPVFVRACEIIAQLLFSPTRDKVERAKWERTVTEMRRRVAAHLMAEVNGTLSDRTPLIDICTELAGTATRTHAYALMLPPAGRERFVRYLAILAYESYYKFRAFVFLHQNTPEVTQRKRAAIALYSLRATPFLRYVPVTLTQSQRGLRLGDEYNRTVVMPTMGACQMAPSSSTLPSFHINETTCTRTENTMRTLAAITDNLDLHAADMHTTQLRPAILFDTSKPILTAFMDARERRVDKTRLRRELFGKTMRKQ